MSVILVGLGVAVGKALFNTLGLGAVANAASGYVIDEAGKKLSSTDLARGLQARLAPVVEHSSLPEEARQPVVDAVTTALQRAAIDAPLLIDLLLDEQRLKRYLLSEQPAAEWELEGEGERELYERVMRVVAEFMVENAPRLPGFAVRSAGAVLQGQERLRQAQAEMPDRVAEHLESEEQRRAEGDVRDWEERYRKKILDTYDRVELFGVRVRYEESRKQRLSVAYVGLFVDPQLRNRDTRSRTARESATAKREEGRPGAGEAAGAPVRVSIEDALARSRRLLILGEAGSGKSTLLQWIAINAARGSFGGPLAGKDDAIPFLIRLRDYVEKELPAAGHFVQHLEDELAIRAPEGWLRECLGSERSIIMVDGVDEMPEGKRERVRRWLEGLITDYPRAQFVVTSRPSASVAPLTGDEARPSTIDEGWLDAQAFDEAQIQPMRPDDIHTFIEHWHAAVREQLWDDEEKNRLEPLAARMKASIDDTASLRNLASSPLLCAALCALNRESGGRLPASRKDVYEALCEMLLERREHALEMRFPGYSEIGGDQRRALLQDAAYWMMQNNMTVAPRERFTDQIKKRLPGLGITMTAPALTQALLERAGIIREPVSGSIDFLHRSLQEYLCARAIIYEDDIEYLLGKATDDQWREVIIWAPAYANKNQRRQIFDDLIKMAEEDPSRHRQLSLLAVACKETADEISPEIRSKLDACLRAIVPPRDMDEARAIAAGGELAIPHLRYAPAYTAEEAAACVRALGIIGGEAAYATLQTYHADSRREVIRELVRAADAFDRDSYFREVLAPHGLTELTFEPVESLDGLQHLTTLESLLIVGSKQVADLRLLEQLPNLNSLSVVIGPGSVELILPQLPKLTSFILQSTDVPDLQLLAQLPNLSTLSLVSLGVSSLEALEKLSNLTALYLYILPEVGELGPLRSLSALSELTLRKLHGLTDLTPLADLTTLTRLAVIDLPTAEDLTPLRQLTELTELTLTSLPGITNLAPLRALTKLAKLTIQDLPGVEDLEPLRQLPSVQARGAVELRLPLNIAL